MDFLVEVSNLCKNYGKVQAVKDVSFNVRKGEFFSLLGPSGCGKTTILRIIGGFIEADSGRVVIGDRDMTSISPNKRNTSMVFQNLALFPHMDVSENIIYGLKKRRFRKDVIQSRLKDMLDIVNLKGYGKRRINELSGGQQQRVALARSLIIEPQLLLLDEPLASLDKKLRISMRSELKDIQSKTGTTFLYVTHDQSEALTMSDTIAVMNEGRVIQTGPAKNIYDDPLNSFVADFIGAGNFIGLSGVDSKKDGLRLTTRKNGTILLKTENTGIIENKAGLAFFIRPEKIKLTSTEKVENGSQDINIYQGKIKKALFEGPDIRLSIENDRIGTVVAEVKNDKVYPGLKQGNTIFFYWENFEGKVLNG